MPRMVLVDGKVKFAASSRRCSSKVRKMLIEQCARRDGPNCHYCGCDVGEWPTLDHKRALSKGGDNSLPNCVIACEPCNSKKGKTPYDKFITIIRDSTTGSCTTL